MFWQYLLCALIGYLIGNIVVSYILAKRKTGRDLRQQGTKNVGASNVAVVAGYKTAFFAYIGDIFKGALAVFIARALFPNLPHAHTLAGCACVFGHMYPFVLRFRGGKGFASYIGLSLALTPLTGLIIGLGAVALAFIADRLIIATIAVMVAYPICMYFISGRFSLSVLFLAITSLVIIIKHRDNIQRFLDGTEPRIRKYIKEKRTNRTQA